MVNSSKNSFWPWDDSTDTGFWAPDSGAPASIITTAPDTAVGGSTPDGPPISVTSLSKHGSPTSGSAGTLAANLSAPAPTTVTSAVSPMAINLVWDTSVGSAPAGFVTDVTAAAQYLADHLSNAVTISINVGYNEVAGSNLISGALGESQSYITSVSYASLVGALSSHANGANDTSVLASLPATSPVSGTIWTTTAQAKALGLLSGSTSSDGAIGFGTGSLFTFGDTATGGTVTAGTYDFFSTAVHELTEVMGRLMLTGQSIGGATSYSLLDLLHYSGTGVRDLSASVPGYFSVDGGATNLAAFNTKAGGDAGDWASSVVDDPLDAFANPGVAEPVSTVDQTVMDAIGWNLVGTSGPPPPPPSGPPPAGVVITPLTNWLSYAQNSGGLRGGSPLAAVSQVGGTAGDSFTYALGGAGASSFTLSTANNAAVLYAGSAGVAGATNGRLYALTVTATDSTVKASATPSPLNVVVGGNSGDTINLASLSGIVTTAPTFIYGLGAGDTINGAGMNGKLTFDGGGGADKMTGGSGINDYVYGATGDSTRTAMDIITNFNVTVDLIDLTGLGSSFASVAALASNATSIGAHSVGWQSSGGNTFVYVNTSGRSESLGSSNMKIELQGNVSLGGGNIVHV